MYLGIDLGTSELKAVLINGQGEIVSSSHMALTVQRPTLSGRNNRQIAGGKRLIRW